MNTIDLALALDVARRAAAAADAASLPHFEQGIQIERKADRSPVTAADRAAEQAILTVITDTFPDHRILAEESGAKSGDPRYRWIIDPIDGTKGFTRGGKFWGSLIALEVEGTVAVGTLSLPALGETYFAARGRGCFCNDAPMKLRPSTSAIADATLSVGDMRPLFGAPWGPSVLALIEEAENARCYGDLVGVTLVLKGIADVWLEAGVKPWDVAPMPVLVEEAGGVFTDFRGTQDLDHGSAIVAGPELHPEILRRFQD